jgi:hypothetical protein
MIRSNARSAGYVIAVTFMVIFLGPPMLLAELITRRTIRWKSSLTLGLWCLACWSAVVAAVVWLL